ncbi:response regulator, partial [Rhodoplanes sp. SY1]|uniref:response regulator n=1 Tax=Rhodoplanes sp. SY1 TaxID=3166646 RepID=UPI0038B4FB76
ARGAFAALAKPTTAERLDAALERLRAFVTRPRKRLLIVDDDRASRIALTELLGDDDLEIAAAETGAEALAALRQAACDGVVLDLRLPDMTGFAVLEAMSADPSLAEVPVIVYTGRSLDAEGHARLRTLARGLPIGPGETIELKPGFPWQAVFASLAGQLRPGDRLPATLVFEQAGAIEVELAVQPIGTGLRHAGTGGG